MWFLYLIEYLLAGTIVAALSMLSSKFRTIVIIGERDDQIRLWILIVYIVLWPLAVLFSIVEMLANIVLKFGKALT